MPFRLYRRALAVLAVYVLVAACTPLGASSPAPLATVQPTVGASQAGGPSPSASSTAPVTLEWYSALNENEPYVAAYKKIVADYHALHPNVTIHVTWMGRQLSTKIRPLLNRASKPDIIEDDLRIMYAGLAQGRPRRGPDAVPCPAGSRFDDGMEGHERTPGAWGC